MTAEPPRTDCADYEISCSASGWQLATGHSEAVSTDIAGDMDRFVGAGITTFDCADIYTGVETAIATGWRDGAPAAVPPCR